MKKSELENLQCELKTVKCIGGHGGLEKLQVSVKLFEKLSFLFPVTIDCALIQLFEPKKEKSDGDFRERFFNT